MTTVPPNVDYGYGPTATANEILRTLVGWGWSGPKRPRPGVD